jgi:hypothetical protein
MQGLRAGLAGMILAMAAHPVFALELGTIHVQSRLNEPFRATIPSDREPRGTGSRRREPSADG